MGCSSGSFSGGSCSGGSCSGGSCGVFELDPTLDYSKFSQLSGQLESLKNTVSGWQMQNDDSTVDKDQHDACANESDGWTHEMNQEKETLVADIATCIERVNNITKALDCVMENHTGLQESFKFKAPQVRRYSENGDEV